MLWIEIEKYNDEFCDCNKSTNKKSVSYFNLQFLFHKTPVRIIDVIATCLVIFKIVELIVI